MGVVAVQVVSEWDTAAPSPSLACLFSLSVV